MTEKRRSYTPEDKAASLAALAANGGNLAKTAAQVGVPRKTLAEWQKQQTPRGGVADASPPKKAAAEQVAKLLPGAKVALSDRLEQVASALVDKMDDPEKIAAATLSQLAVAAGVAIDKMRLLREQPTSIPGATLSDEERARRLAALEERVRRRLAAPADA